jgi:superfamily I DNA/RNA helicase
VKKLTAQQEVIKEELLFTNNNIFICASPGSGKSFTLEMLSKLIPKNKKVIFLAFAKAIKEELEKRLPEHVECATIHSKAYSVLRSNIRVNAKLSDIKKFILAKKLLSKQKDIKNSYLFKLSDIVNLCQMNLVNNQSEIIALCNIYGIDCNETEAKDSFNLLQEVNKYDLSKKDGILDFTDMLYMAKLLVHEDKFPKYDYILLDESQDISPLQRELILSLRKPSTRMISVGDDKQTIFSFQGSNLSSFETLKNLPKTTQLPLSTTFRCAKNIVKESQKYFTDITAYEGNIDGVVRNGNLLEAKDGDFVICRNNLPLIHAFILLLKAGKKCSILGNDLEKSLLNLLGEISDIKDINTLLDNKILKLKEQNISEPANHKSYVELKEKCDILTILCCEFGSVDKLKSSFKTMFSNNADSGIILMTIHKSKGLEANRVFALNFDLLPSKYAITELELYQEKCLQFVCITRAKTELVYCKIKI